MKPTHLAQAARIHKQSNEKELIKATVNDKLLHAEVAAESVTVGARSVRAGFGAACSLCSMSSSFMPSSKNFVSVYCFIFRLCSIDHSLLLVTV